MNKSYVLALALGIAVVATGAEAHHSFSMFDQTKELPIKDAKVTQFRRTNPHSFILVEKDGQIYVMECNSINLMTKGGWKFSTLKAGDKVDLIYYPLRNGKPGGMLKTVKLPNGKTLKAW